MIVRKGLRFWGLWNLSFANFGVAVAFALQQANLARIFQTLGADLENLPLLMIAGPVTGLLVQPLIGHDSDRTWTRLGRRRPWFLGGALLAGMALAAMPNVSSLWMAAALLWIIDVALNVTMEPFRAFIGETVPTDQRAAGFAFNTMLGCIGAVVGSLAPSALGLLGLANTAAAGVVPPSVQMAFYCAAAAILIAVGWTVWRTREYSPEPVDGPQAEVRATALVRPGNGMFWLLGGLAATGALYAGSLHYQLYVLSGAAMLFGLFQIINRAIPRDRAIGHILSDLATMPGTMRKLAVVHFLTWAALFIMWPYMTPVVTQYVFGATDPTSAAYNRGADWVGVMFGVYNGVAALFALAVLPRLARAWGGGATHAMCLTVGTAAFLSLLVVRDPYWLALPFAGLGIAWASLLTMPYVILTGALPQQKFGIYMGIFNFFIVLPQLIVATAMGAVLAAFCPGEPVWTMAIAAALMGGAALAMVVLRPDRPTEGLSA